MGAESRLAAGGGFSFLGPGFHCGGLCTKLLTSICAGGVGGMSKHFAFFGFMGRGHLGYSASRRGNRSRAGGWGVTSVVFQQKHGVCWV
jgi:hypothetical protein